MLTDQQFDKSFSAAFTLVEEVTKDKEFDTLTLFAAAFCIAEIIRKQPEWTREKTREVALEGIGIMFDMLVANKEAEIFPS